MKNDITSRFGGLFEPFKALLIYRNGKDDCYVEALDIGDNGKPVNAHPLSIQESKALSAALDNSDELHTGFLDPSGLMPGCILYINRGRTPFALWQTPPKKVRMLFSEGLSIPNGEAFIPPLIWKASRNNLYLYALTGDNAPSVETLVYKAPFFNIYEDGRVCLGNVNIGITRNCPLEEFMRLWETYFFNSFFSHTLGGQSPVKGNIVQLWQQLISTSEPFPIENLIPTKLRIKDLLK